MAGKVAEAQKVLAKADAATKQIFVVSDMQKLSWETLQQRPRNHRPVAPPNRAKRTARSARSRSSWSTAIGRPKPNVAVTGVDLQAAVPVAGLPIKAVAEVFNTSTVAQQRHLNCISTAWEGSSPVLNLPRQGRMKYEFAFSFKRGGLHRGEVRLVGEDGCKYDDRRFFTMEVNQIPVAVVKQESHEIAYLEDAYYVERALSPARSAGWAITTTPLVASDLASEPLDAFTAIYCVNLKAEPAVAERLRTYVARGGSLVWISGDNVQPGAYNRMNEQAQRQLLPAPLVDVRTRDTPPRATVGTLVSWTRSIRPSRIWSSPTLYKSVLVYKHDAWTRRTWPTRGSWRGWTTASRFGPAEGRARTGHDAGHQRASVGPIFRCDRSSCRCWLG